MPSTKIHAASPARQPARGAEPGPRVKGIAFRTIDTCFTELCGVDARARAHALLDSEVAEAYRYGTLLAASWYPIGWYRDVLAAFRASVSAGPELPRRIGRLSAQHDMKGAHKRLVAWLASPQTLLSLSQRVFNNYYDTGSLQISESRPGFVRMHAVGCLDWDVNMWSELAGSSEALLEIAGARQVQVRWLSGGREDGPDHEFEAHWAH